MALKTALTKMIDEALCDVSKTNDDDYMWPKLDNVDDRYILDLIKVRGVLAGVFKIYAAKSNRTTKETGEMAEIATTLGSLFNFMHVRDFLCGELGMDIALIEDIFRTSFSIPCMYDACENIITLFKFFVIRWNAGEQRKRKRNFR